MLICSQSISKRFFRRLQLRQCTAALLACFVGIGWLGLIGLQPAHSAVLPSPSGEVLLVVSGAIQNANASGEAHFDADMLRSLPQHTLHTSTAVTDGVNRFDGVLVRDLLEAVGAQGQSVRARGLNLYSVRIPLSDFYDYDVLLATSMNGKQLVPSDKGPIWIIYPRDQHRELRDMRFDHRWVWQLNQLVVQ